MQVSILCQFVLSVQGLRKGFHRFRIDSGLVMAHAQLVPCFPVVGSLRSLAIGFQRLHRIGITLHPVACFTLDALHQTGIFMAGIRLKVRIRHLQGTAIILPLQINVRYIIRCIGGIFLTRSGNAETFQRLIVLLARIVDVRQLIDRIQTVCIAYVLQDGKPKSSVFQISFLQISHAQAQKRGIPFGIGKQIDVALLKTGYGFRILLIEKISRPQQGIYPVQVTRVGITPDIGFQLGYTVGFVQFIRSARQHVCHFIGKSRPRLPLQVIHQCLPGCGIIMA